MRELLAGQLKDAMKAGDKIRVGTLRLIMAALKDREIELRGEGKIVSRAGELAVLTKMVKSRQESLGIYQQAGRHELAAQESAEIAIIGEFLPKQMDEAAVRTAVQAAIALTGAASLKDMGKVVAALKEAYPGQMDFAKASAVVKSLLGACRLRGPLARLKGRARGRRGFSSAWRGPPAARLARALAAGWRPATPRRPPARRRACRAPSDRPPS